MKVAILVEERTEGATSGEDARAALEKAGHEVVLVPLGEDLTSSLRTRRPDICLIALDGPAGRDGSLQALLDFLDLPYVGSGAAACRIAGNRGLLADRLQVEAELSGELPVAQAPLSFVLSTEAVRAWGARGAFELLAERLPGGYPLAVAPAFGFGAARRVDDDVALAAAVEDVLADHDEVVVSQWVEGVELTVALLGQGWDAFVLPPVETVVDEEGAARFVAPVRLESLSADEATAQAIRAEVERAAHEAYRACGLQDLGCVRVVWDGAQVRTIEVDVAPDLSADGAFAVACEASGLSLSGVLDRLVELWA